MKKKRYRDAGDGRFVSKEEAEDRPKETVGETIETKPEGKEPSFDNDSLGEDEK